ncbi:MAG: nucleotide sugar dehydrogenase [Bacteroidales bacterium]|nr:MAG: nucleotide sugar dehydrogenase [Bacteroidales bacterium]
MYQKLINKKAKISVTGLGYVGLPIALEFAGKVSVIGFDINKDRIELMKKGIDPSNELPGEMFRNRDILFTTNPEDLRQADFHIITVPTPINEHNLPDIEPLLRASETIGKILKPGDYVVYESTVYPCCTEEECIPVIEEISGLKYKKDFKVGYSPERINPGDKDHTLSRITKVVSGCDEISLENIAKIYAMIITEGIHKVSSIKVAEAAKIIENTQRDINIAFMNELSLIFNRLNINTYEVLEAAGTKWNFLKFYPGLVGGHCIGVDPYYLTYKARELGYHAQIINSGRFVNDSMGGYIAKQTVKKIIGADKNIKNAKILILGVTFKENISDIRNSKVFDIVRELDTYGVNVELFDPHASKTEVKEEYGLNLNHSIGKDYDVVIVAVNHAEFIRFDESFFSSISNHPGILVDVKGIYRGKIKNLNYWSL